MFKHFSIAGIIAGIIFLFWMLVDFTYGLFSAGVGLPIIGGICFGVVMAMLANDLIDRGGR